MRNTYLVAKYALLTTIRSRSFWVITLLMPAFLLAFQVYGAMRENGIEVGGSDEADSQEAEPVNVFRVGLVDEGEMIPVIPPGIPAEWFIRYPDLASARAALRAQEIDQFVVLPAAYLSEGKVMVYDRDFAITTGGSEMSQGFGNQNDWMLDYMIVYNLTGDPLLSQALRNPTPGDLVQYRDLQPVVQEVVEGNKELAILIGRIVPFLFYIILIFGSSYLLGAVTTEKENLTAEVLLVSVQPQEFMWGKILGLGFVTLIQFLIWLAGGFLALQRSAPALGIAAVSLPPDFWVWAAMFLVLGYLVYGGFMVAVGAISPNNREANQTIWIIVLPQLPALMFASEFAENPDGPLAVFLSLFPLSAPGAMVTRLAVTEVPLWQLILSIVGLVITAYLVMRLAGKFFQAGNLLSTTAFSYKRLISGWKNE